MKCYVQSVIKKCDADDLPGIKLNLLIEFFFVEDSDYDILLQINVIALIVEQSAITSI